MPAGVLFGTVTFPSGVSVGVAVFGAFGVAGVTTVTLTVLVVVVAVPIWSLSITDGVLVLPTVTVTTSGVAVIGSKGTTTVAVSVLQLSRFNFSQILYTMV